MQRNKAVRYLMFGLLYFSQGIVLSYFTALNALYFLDNGLAMRDVGIVTSIAMIPFVLKIFLGILSDRVNLLGMGHRKPYILLGLLTQTLCLIVAPFINLSTHYWLFVLVAFILQMGFALYDTCTDGLAVDTTPSEEQGVVQGIMVGSRALGVVLTASIVGLLAEHVSWLAVFLLMAFLTMIPFSLVLCVREPSRLAGQAFQWGAFGAFKQKCVISLAVLGLLFFLVNYAANQLVNPFLKTELRINLSTAGFFTTVWGVGVVLGGIVGGRVMHLFGNRFAIWSALLGSCLAILALAFIKNLVIAWPLVLVFGLTFGTYQVVYYAISMKYTDPRIAASMFSILMAVSNVGIGIGLGLSGMTVESMGYRWSFVLFAGLILFAIPLIPMILGKTSQNI
jgi:PAT family beta-lactamase induction signal transducer AmpG